jgi:hypothetical protein
VRSATKATIALALLFVAEAIDAYGFLRRRIATTAVDPITQLVVNAWSESPHAISSGANEIQHGLPVGTIGAPWDLTESESFLVMPTEATVCDFAVTERGAMTATEDMELRLRTLSSGLPASGTWADTSPLIQTTIEPNGSPQVVNDSDCATLAAGAVASIRVNFDPDNDNDAADGGEGPDNSFELTPTTGGKFVRFGYRPTNIFGNRHWSDSGFSFFGAGDAADADQAVPGSYTMEGFYAQASALPASAIDVYVCEYDAGTDANCGGVGTERFTCPIATTGSGQCNDFAVVGNAAFVKGDKIFYRQNPTNDTVAISVGELWSSSDDTWFSSLTVQGNTTTPKPFGIHGAGGLSNICSFEAECAVGTQSALVCPTVYGTPASSITGTWEYVWRENLADDGSVCSITGTTPCEVGGPSIAAGSRLNTELTRVSSATTGVNLYFATICNDMN